MFSEILSGAIHGAGETVRPMLLKLAGTCALRIAWVLLLVPRSRTMLTIVGSYPASWFLTSALIILYYARFQREKLTAQPKAR